jgi:hypothetical protein
VSNRSDLVVVIAGNYTGCAIPTNGSLWGFNKHGEVGAPGGRQAARPTQVKVP